MPEPEPIPKRVLLSHRGRIYRLLDFWLENNDGSFYVSLVRKGANLEVSQLKVELGAESPPEVQSVHLDKPRPRTKRISYHATGTVRFHDLDSKSIYLEPISSVTQVSPLLMYSVPEVPRLDEYDRDLSEQDAVIDISELTEGRLEFEFLICPWNHVLEDSATTIRYNKLFGLAIRISSMPYIPPKDMTQHFLYVAPTSGLFERQMIDQESALIAFHQKLHDTRDLILYSPNLAGEYKIVCAVPMRIPPDVRISFQDPKLDAVVTHKTRSVIRFKVKHQKSGYVKSEVSIVGIELSAEL